MLHQQARGARELLAVLNKLRTDDEAPPPPPNCALSFQQLADLIRHQRLPPFV